jgi:hypothetical protein
MGVVCRRSRGILQIRHKKDYDIAENCDWEGVEPEAISES